MEFVYPDVGFGDTVIQVESNGLTSNGVPVTILTDNAGQTQRQGGPFGGQPKYAQKKIAFDSVRSPAVPGISHPPMH